jgi:hypothetical protein
MLYRITAEPFLKYLLRASRPLCEYSPMEFSILSPDLKLPDLLDSNGFLRLLPTSAYDQIPHDNLRLWCHQYARYGLPTIELIEWLRTQIADRKVIEIGSGCGDLAHYLGITATDNCMQKWREIKRHYRLVGQPTIKYPDFVQSLDALEAIDQYKPEVVVASWITQWIDPDQPPPPGGGNIWGVKEDEILKRKCVYIFIGNHAVHGSKKIMLIPHKEYKLPFLRSRANQPELDRVWIWNER